MAKSKGRHNPNHMNSVYLELKDIIDTQLKIYKSSSINYDIKRSKNASLPSRERLIHAFLADEK
eukprot:CAMPEP_0117432504 /NCGR_PEP_ID=MMETSP0758-20121206/11977_1 /TAXON_ID=63605 /ORGANISM="Percolomonas cosmopolitus, Strain AE-1 (ATCC 50343)" /LENGTH=63 /DNA_ID=CAMNT_0005222457 /DNA_START=384 /DNA_END=572 /DNA_ORIENTATION=+